MHVIGLISDLISIPTYVATFIALYLIIKLKISYSRSTNMSSTSTLSCKRLTIIIQLIAVFLSFVFQFYFWALNCELEQNCNVGMLSIQILNFLVPVSWLLCFFLVHMEFSRSQAHSRTVVFIWIYQIIISLSWILSAALTYATIICDQTEYRGIGTAIFAFYVILNSISFGLAISMLLSLIHI